MSWITQSDFYITYEKYELTCYTQFVVSKTILIMSYNPKSLFRICQEKKSQCTFTKKREILQLRSELPITVFHKIIWEHKKVSWQYVLQKIAQMSQEVHYGLVTSLMDYSFGYCRNNIVDWYYILSENNWEYLYSQKRVYTL